MSGMPWKQITKMTAAGAVCTFALLVAVAVIGLREEERQAGLTRVRWTDANRWRS